MDLSELLLFFFDVLIFFSALVLCLGGGSDLGRKVASWAIQGQMQGHRSCS